MNLLINTDTCKVKWEHCDFADGKVGGCYYGVLLLNHELGRYQ